jgi:hypothetical protein
MADGAGRGIACFNRPAGRKLRHAPDASSSSQRRAREEAAIGAGLRGPAHLPPRFPTRRGRTTPCWPMHEPPGRLGLRCSRRLLDTPTSEARKESGSVRTLTFRQTTSGRGPIRPRPCSSSQRLDSSLVMLATLALASPKSMAVLGS